MHALHSKLIPHLDALEEAGGVVTESDRLGDGFAHACNHTSPHKWVAVTWRQATANSTLDTVYMGDKKKGKVAYAQFNSTYVPDVIRLKGDDGKPELLEIKNYSPFISTSASAPAVVEFTGHERGMGNTEEALKWRVLGTRQRGLPAEGRYDHSTGTGFVPAHDGDYRDAINNKKATTKMLSHETLGGMSPFAARHLRRLGRDAAVAGIDATDYQLSTTARSFVPFYAQRISHNIVMHGAQGILDGISRARNKQLRAATGAA